MSLLRLFIFLAALYWIYKVLTSSSKKKQKSTFRPPNFGKKRAAEDRGELVQDAHTGTYISKATAVQRKVAGETYYFSSEENAAEFAESKK